MIEKSWAGLIAVGRIAVVRAETRIHWTLARKALRNRDGVGVTLTCSLGGLFLSNYVLSLMFLFTSRLSSNWWALPNTKWKFWFFRWVRDCRIRNTLRACLWKLSLLSSQCCIQDCGMSSNVTGPLIKLWKRKEGEFVEVVVQYQL